MALQSITYKIARDGNIVVETEGFVGDECKEATKDIENRLGDVIDTQLKAEYFSVENNAMENQCVDNKG